VIAFRRRGAALVSGLAVGALLIGGTIVIAQATSPPPRETADLALPLLPVPTLPMPIVPIIPVIPVPSAPPVAAKPQRQAAPARAMGPEGDVVARTNAERIRAGCGALRFDSRLTAAARAHSADMVNRGYFEHESPDGSTPADRAAAAGYIDYGGENIAWGQRSAAEVMSDWLGSPDHRRNILDCEFTSVGVGLDPRGMYWTQDFGY
jgi:uncharacterized protein YkwD